MSPCIAESTYIHHLVILRHRCHNVTLLFNLELHLNYTLKKTTKLTLNILRDIYSVPVAFCNRIVFCDTQCQTGIFNVVHKTTQQKSNKF